MVCFLLATFGWAFGFYGQSVYVAELHRLHGWPASLISSGTTFFYLLGAVLVVFVSEAMRSLRSAQLPAGGYPGDGRSRGRDRPGRRALAAVCGGCGAGFRLGRHQPWCHHQYAWAVVRSQARHGDQPGVERCQLWRRDRRAAAGGGDRPFRLLRRDDRWRGRDGAGAGSRHPDFRGPSARSLGRHGGVGGFGRAVACADTRKRRSRISASCRFRSRSHWCCSRRSASSST